MCQAREILLHPAKLSASACSWQGQCVPSVSQMQSDLATVSMLAIKMKRLSKQAELDKGDTPAQSASGSSGCGWG